MRDLTGQIQRALEEMAVLQRGQRVAVALSGGRDSVCLLHVMRHVAPNLGLTLSAVHVNHGLRQEAGADEAFCRSLCRRWQVPLTVYHVDTKARIRSSGESVEEAARVLRYEALERLPVSWVALAHHQADQAETLLLRLLRGSGLKGLGGMRAVRGRYIRPFLSISPAQLEAYEKEQGLTHVEDASNYDIALQRNRVRHQLLPLLQQFNPEAVRILAQTARLLQDDEDFIESCLPRAEAEEQTLSCSQLLSQPPAIQTRMLRRWLAAVGAGRDIQQVHIQQLLQLAKGSTGRAISLPKGLTIDKSYDILHVCKKVPCLETNGSWHNFETEILPIEQARRQMCAHASNCTQAVPALQEEKWIDADRIEHPPVWRTRRSGDYLIANGGRKKLRDFWIDEKVPRHLRDQIPLLADGSHIIWVYGYRLSDGVKISEHTQRVLHIYVQLQ